MSLPGLISDLEMIVRLSNGKRNFLQTAGWKPMVLLPRKIAEATVPPG